MCDLMCSLFKCGKPMLSLATKKQANSTFTNVAIKELYTNVYNVVHDI